MRAFSCTMFSWCCCRRNSNDSLEKPVEVTEVAALKNDKALLVKAMRDVLKKLKAANERKDLFADRLRESQKVITLALAELAELREAIRGRPAKGRAALRTSPST